MALHGPRLRWRSFTETSERVEGCLTRGRPGRSADWSAKRAGASPRWPGPSGSAGTEPGRPSSATGRPWSTTPDASTACGRSVSTSTRCWPPVPSTTPSTPPSSWTSTRRVLLDVVKNRSSASVSDWLAARTRYFRDHVAVAAIDPHAGYYKALHAKLPKATVTVDVFHAVKLANTCIDEVRRRVQRQTLGHRGHREDPLFGIRRLLTRGYERLSDKALVRLEHGLRWGDPYDEVGGAW